MTVAEVIEQLSKVEDKSLPIYIDCNFCGKALEMKELAHVYIAQTTILHPSPRVLIARDDSEESE